MAGLISLLLLTTGHPSNFQLTTVRASTEFYFRFTLPMVRSPAFGSTTHDLCRAIHTRFPFGFGPEALNLAMDGNSRDHYAKGTPSGIGAETPIALRQFVGARFQVLFHSPHRGSFHHSFALLFAIGRRVVFSLGGWTLRIHTRFHGTGATWDLRPESSRFRLQDFHLLWWAFHMPFD